MNKNPIGKLKILAIYIFLAILFPNCNKNQRTDHSTSPQNFISLTSELNSLFDISKLPDYLDSTYVSQISTYDTTGGNDDGFNGRYSFLRTNVDSSLVIFDVTGSGVINRFWTPTVGDDTLDFYIDNPDKASFSIQYKDLFSGKIHPFIKPLSDNHLGGSYCYIPIPFQKSCKIIYRGKKIQFHQIQYRLFRKECKVKSFNVTLNEEEKNVLNKVVKLWNKRKRNIEDLYDADLKDIITDIKTFELKPGGNEVVFDLNNGGRIIGIELEPAYIFEGLDKQIDIKITWDDEKNPAIFCPVSDFFGYAFGKQSMQSLLIGSLDNKNYCYLPMPFDKHAKIELIDRRSTSEGKDKSKKISTTVYYKKNKRNEVSEGKLYAYWNRNIKPESGKPHVFLDTKGKGHYVGTILQAQGLQPGMTIFFEGDDSTSIDGQPRMHGTGSEDYFNGGWYAFLDCWASKLSLPIHGSLEYNLPLCRTGGYRFFLTDKMSFSKSIFHSIEHGPMGNKIQVDYTSLAFYYSDSQTSANAPPTNDLSKVYIPDTLFIYPQLMGYNIWESLGCKSLWAYPEIGGMSFIFTVTNETKLRISLNEIPCNTYSLFADLEKNKEGCEFSIWQGQTQISGWQSTYQPVKERIKKLYLGDIQITDFKNSMTIRFKTNKDCKTLFLNRLQLIKKN